MLIYEKQGVVCVDCVDGLVLGRKEALFVNAAYLDRKMFPSDYRLFAKVVIAVPGPIISLAQTPFR
jgi:hypothetical protein